MKNLIIVDAFQNNTTRQNALRDCISQLKKSGYDILLTTNAKELPVDIVGMCNYCVYNDDNTLLPAEKSPSCWFADYEDVITITSAAATYVIVKKLALGLSIARTMGYTNFLFIEYDCIIHDNDLPKIKSLFDILDEKKAVFFHFWDDKFPVSEINPPGLETLVFAGNVEYFIEKVELPVTYEQWVNSTQYTVGYLALEHKFAEIFKKEMQNVHVITDKKSPTYFNNSNMDLFSNRYDVHVVTDVDCPTNVTLLIIGNNINTVISLNNNIVFDETVPKNGWRKVHFDITNPVHVEIRTDGKLTEYTLTTENISKYITGTRTKFGQTQ